MATILEVADGLETRLATISGLQASSEWADQPNPPAVIALLGGDQNSEAVIQSSFTEWDYVFRVLVIVNMAAGIGKAFRALYPYLDPSGSSSILAAINADRTLGGVADDVETGAARWTRVGFHEVNSVTYVGAILTPITVYVTQ